MVLSSRSPSLYTPVPASGKTTLPGARVGTVVSVRGKVPQMPVLPRRYVQSLSSALSVYHLDCLVTVCDFAGTVGEPHESSQTTAQEVQGSQEDR